MKFKELESLQDASIYFIQDNNFKRKLFPNESVCDGLAKYLGPEGDQHHDGATSYALGGYFFDADQFLVDGLMSLISEHGLTHFENYKRKGRSANILFHLTIAVARTYKSGVPPDAAIIKSGLIETVLRFEKEKRTLHHFTDIKALIDSVFSAFLAHDLESVERLLSIRKNSKTFPFMDALAREMLKCASYQVIGESKIIRFRNAAVKENFLELLDAHRDWTRKRFMAKYPSDYCCFLVHPFLASYCLAWIFLVSFAEEPIFYVSKQDMRLILTDTQA
jgi:hypothetical protein